MTKDVEHFLCAAHVYVLDIVVIKIKAMKSWALFLDEGVGLVDMYKADSHRGSQQGNLIPMHRLLYAASNWWPLGVGRDLGICTDPQKLSYPSWAHPPLFLLLITGAHLFL